MQPFPAFPRRKNVRVIRRGLFAAAGVSLLIFEGVTAPWRRLHAQQTPPADAPAPPYAGATPFPPAAPPPPTPGGISLFPNTKTTTTTTTTPKTATPASATDEGEERGKKRPRSGDRRRRRENPNLAKAAADPLEVKIAYRRAETEVLRDPALVELRRQAEEVPTDEEKRALLGQYYQTLFARIRRIVKPTPALTAHIDLLSRVAEQRYAPKRRAGAGEDLDDGRGRGRRR